MTESEYMKLDMKIKKAKELRYRNPIVRDLNLDKIKEELWDIQEECENVHWFTDTDEETLINALAGDEDEAYEFKMMFGDLCAECENMMHDLDDEWVPDCFDRFFVAVGAGDDFGGLLGYDSYEQDYFGLSYTEDFVEGESKKVLKQMTKDELIDASRQCFRIFQSYIALRHRYDCLKTSMDILRDKNTEFLKVVKQIAEMYDRAEEASSGFRYDFMKEVHEYDKILNNIPQEAWIQ